MYSFFIFVPNSSFSKFRFFVKTFFISHRAVQYAEHLKVTQIGKFLSLTPEVKSKPIHELADRCVQGFDFLRKQPQPDELKRRRKRGLNPLQEYYLQKWGYPYVLNEFRFHLTLTGPLSDQDLLNRLKRVLLELLTKSELVNIKIESICLFVQKEVGKPFYCHSRYPLGTDAEN